MDGEPPEWTSVGPLHCRWLGGVSNEVRKMKVEMAQFLFSEPTAPVGDDRAWSGVAEGVLGSAVGSELETEKLVVDLDNHWDELVSEKEKLMAVVRSIREDRDNVKDQLGELIIKAGVSRSPLPSLSRPSSVSLHPALDSLPRVLPRSFPVRPAIALAQTDRLPSHVPERRHGERTERTGRAVPARNHGRRHRDCEGKGGERVSEAGNRQAKRRGWQSREANGGEGEGAAGCPRRAVSTQGSQ